MGDQRQAVTAAVVVAQELERATADERPLREDCYSVTYREISQRQNGQLGGNTIRQSHEVICLIVRVDL